MKTYKAKKWSLLWWVGLWATVWWAITGIYFVLVIWASVDKYIAGTATGPFAFPQWRLAISQACIQYPALPRLFWFILAMWILGLLVWLEALKQNNISYKAGLKDLFLTLR